MIKIDRKESNGGLTVALQGRLDAASVQECTARIGEFETENGQKLTIDCTSMEYMSSAGIRFLLLVRKKVVEKGGCVALTGVNGEVSQVFDMTGLRDMFEM